jgi:hypothetical protein
MSNFLRVVTLRRNDPCRDNEIWVFTARVIHWTLVAVIHVMNIVYARYIDDLQSNWNKKYTDKLMHACRRNYMPKCFRRTCSHWHTCHNYVTLCMSLINNTEWKSRSPLKAKSIRFMHKIERSETGCNYCTIWTRQKWFMSRYLSQILSAFDICCRSWCYLTF